MNSTPSCSRRNFLRPVRPGVATRLLALLAIACCLDGRLPAADNFTPLGLREVQVGGEIGRRINVMS